MKVRHNVLNITSLKAFASIKGGVNQGCKDVCFIRCIGHDSGYLDEIEAIDQLLTQRENCGQGKYKRSMGLPRLDNPNEILFYSNMYGEWEKSGRKYLTLKDLVMGKELEEIVIQAFDKIMEKFHECSPNANESIRRNFFVKIMYWLHTCVHSFLADWKERESYKFIVHKIVKKQEYLFLYFLTFLRIDVMILMPEGEMKLDRSLLELSYQLQLGSCSDMILPEYDKRKYIISPDKTRTSGKRALYSTRKADRQEKDFEELAMLSSSVVMISVHNSDGAIIATGSGIIISADGYILTNNHVASGGRYYSVRIEDDEQIYETDEIMKYNSFLDLTLIRIKNRRLKPIPVYRGTKGLVRGQKVLAIGSPLGMFNSVSDGIISGFRNIDDVEMIQFTAPISRGSSGGALLNLYGEVIGISTAGIDSGQNINLAVDYQNINRFVQGFM